LQDVTFIFVILRRLHPALDEDRTWAMIDAMPDSRLRLARFARCFRRLGLTLPLCRDSASLL